MRLLPKLWSRLTRHTSRKSQPRANRRLQLEHLEDRCLPATGSGSIIGVAFIDANSNHVHETRETTVPGINITLTGTTTQGTPVNVLATTDASGLYTFANVLPGTYAVKGAAGKSLLDNGESAAGGITIVGGDTVFRDLGFHGLAPKSVNLRLLLASTTPAAVQAVFDPAGPGTSLVNQRPNNKPTVSAPIGDVAVPKNSADTTVDLTTHFTDPDLTITGSGETQTFSVVGNTNPQILTASISGTQLDLHYAADQTGSAIVTVKDTDQLGASVQTSFNVTVLQNVTTLSVALNTNAPKTNDTLTATTTVSQSVPLTYVWKVNGNTVKTTSSTTSKTDTLDLSQAGNGDSGQTVTVNVSGGGGSDTGTATVANSAPVVKTAVANVSVAQNSANTVLDLAGNFDDPDIADSTIQFQTSDGPINIELFDKQAPRTVANFLNYVKSGRFNSTVFHRNAVNPDGSEFVLQGGGFTFTVAPLNAVTTDPSVQNEFDAVNRPNTLGTIAMAKTSDPNSANSQFFFNLQDNSSTLDNTANSGGFTVFGKLASAADQAVVNQLAAIPVNVVQTIAFGGTPTGGSFTLVFKSGTSTPITWNATASTLQASIQSALDSLSTVGSGNTVVTSLGASSTSGFTVTFKNSLNTAIPLMLTNNSLTGTSPTVTVNARENAPFNEIPLNNYTGTNFPTDTTAANYALITSASIINQPEALTYTVLSNSNPGLVTPTISNERLTLAYTANQAGVATITVRATDKAGATVDDTFTVTVT